MKKLIFIIVLLSTLIVKGQLTSVGLEAPMSLFIAPVENSQLTSNGTLKLKFQTSITANTFFAAPNVVAGTPDFRGIVAADLPVAASGSSGIINTSNQTFGSGNKTFPGIAFFTNGSVAAPSIAFTSPGSTGFSYATGGSVEAIIGSFNGTEKFEFTSEGRFVVTNVSTNAAKLGINVYKDAYINEDINGQDGGINVTTYGGTSDNPKYHTSTFIGRTSSGTASVPAPTKDDQAMAEFTGKGWCTGCGTDGFETSNRGGFGIYAAIDQTASNTAAYAGIKTTRYLTAVGSGNHMSLMIDPSGNAGLTYLETGLYNTTPSIGWGASDDDRFFSIEGTSNGDAGIFIQNSTGSRGLNIWLDFSANTVYFDNVRNNNAAVIQTRLRSTTGSPPVAITTGLFEFPVGSSTYYGGTNFGTDATPDNVLTVGSSSQFQVDGSGKIVKYNSTISDGELLIGKTSGCTFEKATLTAGTGISVNNSAGAITINASFSFTAIADKTVANTTTETTLLASGVGSLTINANSLVAGKSYIIKAYGYVSTDASAPNWTVKAKLGSTVIATTTGAATASLSNRRVEIMTILTCRTLGVSGTVAAQGYFGYNSNATNGFTREMVNTSTFTIDTTVSQAIDLTFTWSVANENNTITITNTTIEAMN